MSTITYQAITEALSEIKANQLNEDGHTDVPSSMRMCMTIMEDAHDILCALKNTEMDEEIDTWWTNKLAVSASTLNKLRDYYVHEIHDHEEQPDEVDMEIEENAPTDFARKVGQLLFHRGLPGQKPSPSTMGRPQGVLAGRLEGPIRRFLYPRKRGMPPAARRQASMRTEDLEENIDIDFTDVANKYGKYAIPAGAALGAHVLLGKRREPFRNAVVAGAAGLGAEAAKEFYMSRNPNATSPYLQPAKIPEFKPTGQG